MFGLIGFQLSCGNGLIVVKFSGQVYYNYEFPIRPVGSWGQKSRSVRFLRINRLPIWTISYG